MDLVELAHEVITLSNQDGNKVSSTPGDTPPHILPARFHSSNDCNQGITPTASQRLSDQGSTGV